MSYMLTTMTLTFEATDNDTDFEVSNFVRLVAQDELYEFVARRVAVKKLDDCKYKIIFDDIDDYPADGETFCPISPAVGKNADIEYLHIGSQVATILSVSDIRLYFVDGSVVDLDPIDDYQYFLEDIA